MEKLRQTLRDSKTARWTALGIVAFTMLCGYYLTDVMAPLKGMLEGQLKWSSSQYGFFTSAYGWFNVFLLFLIIGGIILDKMGVRFTGLMAASIMVVGTAIKYWAVSTHALDGQTWHILWFDMNAQVFMAAIGFAIFGVGVEVAGITVSKIIVKWFKGKELALAMGLEMATARLGTALALSTSLPIAEKLGNVSAPILVCLIMLCIGLISFIIYTFMDKKLDHEQAAFDKANAVVDTEDSFKISDIWKIFTNKGWWYIAILCVLFYSAVFPFLKYAQDLMVNKFGVADKLAGSIPALLPFGTILLTPLFGNLYDRKGKGASIMIIGALILVFVHAMFSIPFLNHWLIAIVLIVLLGIGFSLVPSAMWPSVPKIIPEKQLGTAYSMIFWVQNWGLMGVPALIGWVLDEYCITGQVLKNGAMVNTYNYTLPMLIFMSLGILAILFAFLLKAEDKKKGYGLQMPNIVK
ncbi:MAG: oxalate:formate antiporter [Bacteroidetes bacterium GWF2_49_14]|nr:MAG: oxalate:formate antiporter [Bacteroidetes bacterium GWF2_49_14]HBB91273.1 oxalate:formate antiporter [Bacteroidales bacterium]